MEARRFIRVFIMKQLCAKLPSLALFWSIAQEEQIVRRGFCLIGHFIYYFISVFASKLFYFSLTFLIYFHQTRNMTWNSRQPQKKTLARMPMCISKWLEKKAKVKKSNSRTKEMDTLTEDNWTDSGSELRMLGGWENTRGGRYSLMCAMELSMSGPKGYGVLIRFGQK